ncbi:MAG: DinB family protein [Actinomycetota bacterium]
MDPEIAGRNRAATDRLRTVAARLSERELLVPIDPPWTASALFAHMAFWDRFAHARWLRARATGGAMPLQIDEEPLETINEAALPGWAVVPPRVAVEECLTAAEAIDRLIETLEADVVSGVVAAGRERLVDRSIHRSEHLATIDRAYP